MGIYNYGDFNTRHYTLVHGLNAYLVCFIRALNSYIYTCTAFLPSKRPCALEIHGPNMGVGTYVHIRKLQDHQKCGVGAYSGDYGKCN